MFLERKINFIIQGETAPIIKSIELAVGQKISRKGLVFSGGTAKQIVGDLLMANNIPIENNPKIYEIPKIFNQVMKEALEDGSLTYEVQFLYTLLENILIHKTKPNRYAQNNGILLGPKIATIKVFAKILIFSHYCTIEKDFATVKI